MAFADLELHLFNCKIKKVKGVERVAADARLEHLPAGGGRAIKSGQFSFVAPWGPVEAEDLSWYLERFHDWPWGVFLERARRITDNLPLWGEGLFKASLGDAAALPIYYPWKGAGTDSDWRFTVVVEYTAENSDAASRLLSLPWEMLYTDGGFLFQGGQPVRVRRSLPTNQAHQGYLFQPPLRILLVSPRSDHGYFDHRVAARPLTEALAALGDLVVLTVLETPTFPELSRALLEAKRRGQPFHVVHFDGHGSYDPVRQLGGLYFEDPQDAQEIDSRRAVLVSASELAQAISGHGTPLFYLDACQGAQAMVNPTTSVAGALMAKGVASVVAMSHSVLVESARRFVEAFYGELARGGRIGDAMLAGQRALHGDPYRFDVPHAGPLYMQDWFVPLLYQEADDPVLIETTSTLPGRKRKLRVGELPDAPEHGFVGRSRELLTLERLLLQKDYAVIQGEGGEGKTALAVELARWLATIRRVGRVIFVSLESHTHARAVLDFLGQQLLAGFTVTDPNAWASLEAELEKSSTLVVLDNLETVLPPRPGADLGVFEPEEWQELLELFKKFMGVEGAKLLFTSREALPAPFSNHHVKLDRLETDEAVQLVAGVL
ncbi:MAG: CHAT domain-containing protein, partial [Magnetococcales bacterium]|nr:CHAT domain-containing protein [Magnetococcales bacterium]